MRMGVGAERETEGEGEGERYQLLVPLTYTFISRFSDVPLPGLKPGTML